MAPLPPLEPTWVLALSALYVTLYFGIYTALAAGFGRLAASTTHRDWVLANRGKGETDTLRVHDWASEATSTLNALVQSSLSFYLFWAYSHDEPAYHALVQPWLISLGSYMVFDCIVCFKHGAWLLKRTPGLLVHHVCVGLSNFYALSSPDIFVYYQVVATLCEANTFFLHTRTGLKMVRPRLAWLRWPNEFLMLLTFVTVRFPTSGYLVYQMLRIVSDTHEPPLKGVAAVDKGVWAFCAIGLFGVNVVAFTTLLSGYAKAARTTPKHE
eukprot:m.176577 g.176577  ORF g.176577 m.176577 type:complete len:269 (-) comp24451_c0_seq1:200-1006(-)